MKVEFDYNAPIYLQIVDMVKNDIIAGKYKCGEKLPSVRDMAAQMGVNPNTMQRALTYLELESLIFNERTSGRYVTEDCEYISKIGSEIVDSKISTFATEISCYGLSGDEILDKLSKKLMENNKGDENIQ